VTSILPRRVTSALAALACLAILFAPCGPSSVVADDSRYSLGTIQYDEHLEMAADSRLTTLLAFYNVDGTLPVDLELYVVEAPQGLTISLARPDAEAGSAGTDVLSLRVSSSVLYEESPDCQSAGQRAVYLPTRGYVCADVVEVVVDATGAEVTTQDLSFRIGALATWEGGAAPAQERVFQYQVSVLPSSDTRDLSGFVFPALVAVLLSIAGFLFVKRVAK